MSEPHGGYSGRLGSPYSDMRRCQRPAHAQGQNRGSLPANGPIPAMEMVELTRAGGEPGKTSWHMTTYDHCEYPTGAPLFPQHLLHQPPCILSTHARCPAHSWLFDRRGSPRATTRCGVGRCTRPYPFWTWSDARPIKHGRLTEALTVTTCSCYSGWK